jgi:hypothetical protein
MIQRRRRRLTGAVSLFEIRGPPQGESQGAWDDDHSRTGLVSFKRLTLAFSLVSEGWESAEARLVSLGTGLPWFETSTRVTALHGAPGKDTLFPLHQNRTP